MGTATRPAALTFHTERRHSMTDHRAFDPQATDLGPPFPLGWLFFRPERPVILAFVFITWLTTTGSTKVQPH